MVFWAKNVVGPCVGRARRRAGVLSRRFRRPVLCTSAYKYNGVAMRGSARWRPLAARICARPHRTTRNKAVHTAVPAQLPACRDKSRLRAGMRKILVAPLQGAQLRRVPSTARILSSGTLFIWRISKHQRFDRVTRKVHTFKVTPIHRTVPHRLTIAAPPL